MPNGEERKLVQYPNRSCGACVCLVELVTILGMVTALEMVTQDGMTTVTVTVIGMVTHLGDRECTKDGEYPSDWNCLRNSP